MNEILIESKANKKLFECDVCQRGFTRSTSLSEHKYIHSNVKPFECLICGQTFRQNSNYNKHQKLHQKRPKPIGCDVCGRQFSTHSSLKSHSLSHNNFKSCLCDKCGNTFKYRCDLKRHLKIHENSRSHQCSVCGFGFNDISALRRHQNKVHKTKDKTSEQLIPEISMDSNHNIVDNTCNGSHLKNQMSDLNDGNYLNSVIDYINVCRILPVPLPDHIFEKLVELHKEIAIHLGTDSKCEKEFYIVLRTSLQDLNAIIGEHLELKYKIIQ